MRRHFVATNLAGLLLLSVVTSSFLSPVRAQIGPIKPPSGGSSSSSATTISDALFCVDAGASDAYACNLTPAITAYAAGFQACFDANTANTGASSINFNSLGALTIKRINQTTAGLDTATGDIVADQIVCGTYNGTSFFINNNIPSLLAADGSVSAPSIAFAADQDGSGTGIYRGAANDWRIAANGVFKVAITTNAALFAEEVVVGNATYFGFSDNASPLSGTYDTRLYRGGAAATLELGADVNGAPVHQTFKAADGITGTDIAGANMTVTAGRGTGAGTPGALNFQVTDALTTGTTQQTLSTRMTISGGGGIWTKSGTKTLTAGAATDFVQVAVTSNGRQSGYVEYSIDADDGTDFQERSGVLYFAAVNKAGTETCTLFRAQGSTTVDDTTDGLAQSSASTLTNTFTCDTGGTNAITLRANAASGLVETTLRINYTVYLTGNAATTVTPQ